MTPAEIDEAVKELKLAWYSPLPDALERVWRRTLPGIDKTTFKSVLDDFVMRHIGRPPPSEFYDLAMAKRRAATDRSAGVVCPPIPESEATRPEDVAGWVRALRDPDSELRRVGA